jgi:hypothetical protein
MLFSVDCFKFLLPLPSPPYQPTPLPLPHVHTGFSARSVHVTCCPTSLTLHPLPPLVSSVLFAVDQYVLLVSAAPVPAQPPGFSSRECARDLLPHFLDFAPPGSSVLFAVGPFDEPPPEVEYEGTVEGGEEQERGGTGQPHQLHYR